jgi:hypothetical protein
MESAIVSPLSTLIKKNKIDISESLISDVAYHVYTLMYNICAMAATITRLHDPLKPVVKPRHLKSSLEYIQNKCYPKSKLVTNQAGGSYHIDAEYFGKNSGAYTGEEYQSTLDIDFKNQIIRPEISGGKGKGKGKAEATKNVDVTQVSYMEISYLIISNSKKQEIFSTNEITKILNGFNVSISSATLDVLKKLLRMHLNCLMMDLYEESPVTKAKLDKIMTLKRHSVFL